MRPLHILYLSGFGDHYDGIRKRLLSKWRFKDVTVELIPMNWMNDETFEQKIARINRAIDAAKGKRVVIIGESAAGSMAVHVYAARSNNLFKVMTICGKNTHPETVSPYYLTKYPAFKTSMDTLNKSLKMLSKDERQRFVSVRPLRDRVVPVEEMRIPDCRELTLPTKGHLFTIVIALTTWSKKVVLEAGKAQSLL